MTLDKILISLSGKKTSIVAIAGLIISYLSEVNYIDTKLAVLLNSIILILAFGANWQTPKAFQRENKTEFLA